MFNLPDPYKGFDASAYSLDIQGWGAESTVFEDLIATVRPKTIVEVGTWKGASACRMAHLCKSQALNTRIICIDTWLGALEMWTDVRDKDRFLSLGLRNGYPTLYYQFLSNVVQLGHTDCITPLPMSSSIGCKFLQHHKIKADMVYIDASHDYDDVLKDITDYKSIVRSGGVLFGDDYSTWDGVKRAVIDSQIPYRTAFDDRNWIMEIH